MRSLWRGPTARRGDTLLGAATRRSSQCEEEQPHGEDPKNQHRRPPSSRDKACSWSSGRSPTPNRVSQPEAPQGPLRVPSMAEAVPHGPTRAKHLIRFSASTFSLCPRASSRPMTHPERFLSSMPQLRHPCTVERAEHPTSASTCSARSPRHGAQESTGNHRRPLHLAGTYCTFLRTERSFFGPMKPEWWKTIF